MNFRLWVHRPLGGVATSVSAHNVKSDAGITMTRASAVDIILTSVS